MVFSVCPLGDAAAPNHQEEAPSAPAAPVAPVAPVAPALVGQDAKLVEQLRKVRTCLTSRRRSLMVNLKSVLFLHARRYTEFSPAWTHAVT